MMKKSKFSEHQIVNILKEYESGNAIRYISGAQHISTNFLLEEAGVRRYGYAQHLKELKVLQEENSSLKRMFADLSLDHRILKDILEDRL